MQLLHNVLLLTKQYNMYIIIKQISGILTLFYPTGKGVSYFFVIRRHHVYKEA